MAGLIDTTGTPLASTYTMLANTVTGEVAVIQFDGMELVGYGGFHHERDAEWWFDLVADMEDDQVLPLHNLQTEQTLTSRECTLIGMDWGWKVIAQETV